MAKTFIQIQDGDGNVREVEIDEEVRDDKEVEEEFGEKDFFHNKMGDWFP